MKFTQRLAYYLFGILIGCMFLVYFFGEKKTEFCYLPNCRVLKDLRSKPVVYSKEAEAIFKEGWVTNDDVRNTLNYGKVDFDKSNIKEEDGKLYVIKGRNEANETIYVEMVNYSDKVKLKSITKEVK
ncbi:DUF4258 domain-containing protein [Myroides pelagicus]|uniref:DUF4258 domain-containing protein n=1 Tax=Myroides pelagicus TaxID=270914 RepID=A0A7K1GL06_9FLAO|nr:DUF4258 domain-containing protein [Myroides pelagicus]MEC4113878.1 DUF4258 domain-containing protein [Myroides pelagicus]MTH29113.1 DUF4258 domain-containing protein [Myroides pelagicus]